MLSQHGFDQPWSLSLGGARRDSVAGHMAHGSDLPEHRRTHLAMLGCPAIFFREACREGPQRTESRLERRGRPMSVDYDAGHKRRGPELAGTRHGDEQHQGNDSRSFEWTSGWRGSREGGAGLVGSGDQVMTEMHSRFTMMWRFHQAISQ